jgi:Txe/YoeB family toxin of Txe-Axe toxin-antitoxin module
MISLESALNYFPEEILNERKSKNPILAYNAGIFGGSDISFFKEYTSKAFEFVGKNTLNLSKINIANFNIFFEQYLFYCLVQKSEKKVNVLLTEIIGDNQYKGFGDFARVPYEKHYLHLLGSYKRNEFVCKQMANRLRQDYPDYYYRIIELFKKNRLPLFKDHYDLENISEQSLVCRYHHLKNNFFEIEKKECINSLKFDYKRDLKKELGNIVLNKDQFIDFEIFTAKINSIVKKDFALISRNYLYARDCNLNFYFQYLFEKSNEIYNKKLIRDNNYQIIESKYNWSSFIERQKVKKEDEIIKLEKSEKIINTIIIPECDQDKFSIAYVDDLDLAILEILKNVKTIQKLFDEIAEFFETDELNKSFIEFQKLIFGRIKLGIHIKSIKVEYL